MTCRSIRYSVIATVAMAAGLVLTPLAEAQVAPPEGGVVRQGQVAEAARKRGRTKGAI